MYGLSQPLPRAGGTAVVNSSSWKKRHNLLNNIKRSSRRYPAVCSKNTSRNPGIGYQNSRCYLKVGCYKSRRCTAVNIHTSRRYPAVGFQNTSRNPGIGYQNSRCHPEVGCYNSRRCTAVNIHSSDAI
ncbi:hypothetical protein J6590_058879 [Homalodisca vitripennis]|nr:hypothetical protein J6590_058879 [Homalodisca vitripennis]